jgi:hypothetical protein
VEVGVKSGPAEAMVEAWRLFISQGAHDLNNHLAAILGRAELALMADDPVRWRRGLEETLEAGQPARTLVADLQRLSLWQQTAPAPTPLADVLALVARVVQPTLRRSGVDLLVDGGCGAVLVEHPGVLALALWLLLRDAADRAGRCTAGTWGLSGGARESDAVWAVTLATPGVDHTLEMARPAGEVQRSGGRSSGLRGAALELVASSGGRLESRGETVSIQFPG